MAINGFDFNFWSLFPSFVNEISKLLGFQVLSNFILFVFALINLLILMQLTLSVGKSENQIQTLAEEIALLKSELKDD